MLRGSLHPELKNCFNLDAKPRQIAALLDDLSSRNKMLAIVRTEEKIASITMVKVRKTEKNDPVLLVERSLYRFGYNFEPEILKALEKTKLKEMKDTSLTTEIHRQPREDDQMITLYTTSTRAPEEYHEAVFGLRPRSNNTYFQAKVWKGEGARLAGGEEGNEKKLVNDDDALSDTAQFRTTQSRSTLSPVQSRPLSAWFYSPFITSGGSTIIPNTMSIAATQAMISFISTSSLKSSEVPSAPINNKATLESDLAKYLLLAGFQNMIGFSISRLPHPFFSIKLPEIKNKVNYYLNNKQFKLNSNGARLAEKKSKAILTTALLFLLGGLGGSVGDYLHYVWGVIEYPVTATLSVYVWWGFALFGSATLALVYGHRLWMGWWDAKPQAATWLEATLASILFLEAYAATAVFSASPLALTIGLSALWMLLAGLKKDSKGAFVSYAFLAAIIGVSFESGWSSLGNFSYTQPFYPLIVPAWLPPLYLLAAYLGSTLDRYLRREILKSAPDPQPKQLRFAHRYAVAMGVEKDKAWEIMRGLPKEGIQRFFWKRQWRKVWLEAAEKEKDVALRSKMIYIAKSLASDKTLFSDKEKKIFNQAHNRFFGEKIKILQEIKIPLKGSDKPVTADLLLPEALSPAPVVILLHGMTHTRFEPDLNGLVKKLLDFGIAVLRVDLPGHGDNKNPLKNPEDFNATIQSVLEYLRKNPFIDSKKIGLAGFSLGAHAVLRAILADAKDPSKASLAAFAVMAPPTLYTLTSLGHALLRLRPTMGKQMVRIFGAIFFAQLKPIVKKFALDETALKKLTGEKDLLKKIAVVSQGYDEIVLRKDVNLLAQIFQKPLDKNYLYFQRSCHYLTGEEREKADKFIAEHFKNKFSGTRLAGEKLWPDPRKSLDGHLQRELGHRYWLDLVDLHGLTSIALKPLHIDKASSLKHLFESNPTLELAYYVGDEFFENGISIGGDVIILKAVEELEKEGKEIHALSVDKNPHARSKKTKDKTMWIGSEHSSTKNMFREVVEGIERGVRKVIIRGKGEDEGKSVAIDLEALLAKGVFVFDADGTIFAKNTGSFQNDAQMRGLFERALKKNLKIWIISLNSRVRLEERITKAFGKDSLIQNFGMYVNGGITRISYELGEKMVMNFSKNIQKSDIKTASGIVLEQLKNNFGLNQKALKERKKLLKLNGSPAPTQYLKNAKLKPWWLKGHDNFNLDIAHNPLEDTHERTLSKPFIEIQDSARFYIHFLSPPDSEDTKGSRLATNTTAHKRKRTTEIRRILKDISDLKDPLSQEKKIQELVNRKEMSKSDVSTLIKILSYKDFGIVHIAVEVLARLGMEIVSILWGAVLHENFNIRAQITLVLSRIRHPIIGVLIDALSHPHHLIRLTAADALGMIGAEAHMAVLALIKALQDENYWVRQAAAIALGEMRTASKTSVPGLIKLLKEDDHPHGRSAAAEALGKIGNPHALSAVPTLQEKAKNDKNTSVRKKAAGAIDQILAKQTNSGARLGKGAGKMPEAKEKGRGDIRNPELSQDPDFLGLYRNFQVGELTLKSGIIPDLLEMAMENYPDRIFLVVSEGEKYRNVSYREFNDKVTRTKKMLYSNGVRAQDRVLFISPNRIEFVEVAMAVWGLGGVVTSANPRAPEEYLLHIVKNSQASFLVVPAALLNKARLLKIHHPKLKIFVFESVDSGDLQANEVSLNSQLEDLAVPLPKITVHPEDLAVILYTSGSTKLPKGVPLTHLNILYNREAGLRAWKGCFGPGDKTLGFLAFFHIMGLVSEFLGDLYMGAQYVFPRLRGNAATPEELLAAIKETSATVLYSTPSMLERMKPIAEKDSSSLEILKTLKFIPWGGATIRAGTAEYFQNNSVKLIQGYGLTETTGAILWGDPQNLDWRILYPMPGIEAQFTDTSNAEQKELMLADSPSVMRGYVDNPKDTAKVFPQPNVFHTGDIFTSEGSGYVYKVRNDDIFKLGGGEKIDPPAFETEMEKDQRIKKSAVIGEGMPRAALVVELHWNLFPGEAAAKIESEIWEGVQKANQSFPANMQIKKENLLILKPGEEPLPVGPKGNLLRSELKKRFTPWLEEHFGLSKTKLPEEEEFQGRIILVGGSFDDHGGTPSSLISQIHQALPKDATLVNGGYFTQIVDLIQKLDPYNAVLWFPNISNEKEKLRDIKTRYPDKILVTSKRNRQGKYSDDEIALHASKLQSNLAVEFSDTIPFRMRLMDPLGNIFEDTKSPVILAKTLLKKLNLLKKGLDLSKKGGLEKEKTSMDAIIIGGIFDQQGGKPVKWIDELKASLSPNIGVINGGSTAKLNQIVEDVLRKHEVIIWFPQLPAEAKHMTSRIKELYPYRTLITAVFNWDKTRKFQEMVNEALGLRSNLWVEFLGREEEPRAILRDPLSNEYADARTLPELAQKIIERLSALDKFTRQGSRSLGSKIQAQPNPMLEKFFEIVRRNGVEFHRLVHPEQGVNRFLGNASFRGSSIFSDPKLSDLIFVSQRNVDKRLLGLNTFVPVLLSSSREEKIAYYGDTKPSVDSPIQVRLYEIFPKVNFMLHAHVYVDGAPFTGKFCPCGSLEEIEEIIKTVGQDTAKTNFAVNLLGHGCLIFSDNPQYFEKTIKFHARPIPEHLNTDGSRSQGTRLAGEKVWPNLKDQISFTGDDASNNAVREISTPSSQAQESLSNQIFYSTPLSLIVSGFDNQARTMLAENSGKRGGISRVRPKNELKTFLISVAKAVRIDSGDRLVIFLEEDRDKKGLATITFDKIDDRTLAYSMNGRPGGLIHTKETIKNGQAQVSVSDLVGILERAKESYAEPTELGDAPMELYFYLDHLKNLPQEFQQAEIQKQILGILKSKANIQRAHLLTEDAAIKEIILKILDDPRIVKNRRDLFGFDGTPKDSQNTQVYSAAKTYFLERKLKAKHPSGLFMIQEDSQEEGRPESLHLFANNTRLTLMQLIGSLNPKDLAVSNPQFLKVLDYFKARTRLAPTPQEFLEAIQADNLQAVFKCVLPPDLRNVDISKAIRTAVLGARMAAQGA
jgi:long-subunit acyl-CoA synthetase (AMP-forming)/HEAT repeat protein/dienelactone hydrolase